MSFYFTRKASRGKDQGVRPKMETPTADRDVKLRETLQSGAATAAERKTSLIGYPNKF